MKVPATEPSRLDSGTGLPALRLITFGVPTVRLAGAPPPPEVLWRKHLALLIYLALSPLRTRSRSHLLGLLWAEKEETRARHSLNEAIRRLRSCLGAGRLVTDRESVALAPEGLEVDALEPWQPSLERPGGLVRGCFLEGFSVDDAPAFEEWAEAERARWREHDTSLLVTYARELLQQGRCQAALEAARQVLVLEPYSEPAIRAAMEARALGGDAAGALRDYQAFAASLERLGELPGRALANLARRIREGAGRPSPPGTPAPEIPLVGRSRELALAARWLPGEAGRAAVVCLRGEPGLGRTRLLQELLARAALGGAVVATARPNERDAAVAWSSLRGLVRGGLLGAPGLAAAEPRHLAVLASLVPELALRQAPASPADQAEVGLALAGMLGAIAEEAPVALGLDDAHLADPATLTVLRLVLESRPGLPLLLALTMVPDDADSPRELHQLLAGTGREIPGQVVSLPPLARTDLRDLAEVLAPWCRTPEDRDRLARRLEADSAGRPLLAVTVLRGLEDAAALHQDALRWPPPGETLDSPLPMGIPALIRSAVLAQLARLPSEARDLVARASLLGSRLDPPLLAALTGLEPATLVERLAAAERAHLIRAEATGYVFTSPLIAQVLSHGYLTPGQMRQVRQRAAELLQGRTDLEARLVRLELLVRLGEAGAAAALAVEIAEEGWRAGDRRAVRRSLHLAEPHLGALPEAAQDRLRRLRASLA